MGNNYVVCAIGFSSRTTCCNSNIKTRCLAVNNARTKSSGPLCNARI
jgi:hypothetical protein